MISEQNYQRFLREGRGFALDNTWLLIGFESASFDELRKNFLSILRKHMSGLALKLAKNGVFLSGDVDVQMEIFDKALPKTEVSMIFGQTLKDGKLSPEQKIYFSQLSSRDKIIQESFWFFSPECPGGAVWIDPDDKSYTWT